MVTATRNEDGTVALNLSGRKLNVTQSEADMLVTQLLMVKMLPSLQVAMATGASTLDFGKMAGEIVNNAQESSYAMDPKKDPFAIEPEVPPPAYIPSPVGAQSGLPEIDKLVAKPTSGIPDDSPSGGSLDYMLEAEEKLSEERF